MERVNPPCPLFKIQQIEIPKELYYQSDAINPPIKLVPVYLLKDGQQFDL